MKTNIYLSHGDVIKPSYKCESKHKINPPSDVHKFTLKSISNTKTGMVGGSLKPPTTSTTRGVALFKSSNSSFLSFTQFYPTCGRIPSPPLSPWPGRQPCRPRLVDGWRGGGPSSVAPRSRNPTTGRRRDSPISSSLFSHGQLENHRLDVP